MYPDSDHARLRCEALLNRSRPRDRLTLGRVTLIVTFVVPV